MQETRQQEPFLYLDVTALGGHWSVGVKSASEYRQHAKDCRALAKTFTGERRQQTIELAETWEDLARQVDSAQNRHLAGMIKSVYDDVANEPVPACIRELLWRLDAADSRGG